MSVKLEVAISIPIGAYCNGFFWLAKLFVKCEFLRRTPPECLSSSQGKLRQHAKQKYPLRAHAMIRIVNLVHYKYGKVHFLTEPLERKIITERKH